MDDQLVIDSSGAWVRKTTQLMGEKPLLPPENSGGLPSVVENSIDFMNDQLENTYIVLLD